MTSMPTVWHLLRRADAVVHSRGARVGTGVVVHRPRLADRVTGNGKGRMSDVDYPAPKPRRVSVPSWLDLRLILGVVLVVASVGAGALVVASARRTGRELAVT